MDHRTLAVITLRALAQLYLLQGNVKAHESLSFLASGIESGANIDEHMRGVAELLNSDIAVDWDDVHARVIVESERLRARASDPPSNSE